MMPSFLTCTTRGKLLWTLPAPDPEWVRGHPVRGHPVRYGGRPRVGVRGTRDGVEEGEVDGFSP